MKVLITGGCGFLGSNLAAALIEKNNKVIILDSLFRSGSQNNLNWLLSKAKDNQISYIQGDLANQELVANVFRRYAPFDFICHVGGQVAMTTSLTDPLRDLKTNVIGTFNILEAARKYSPEALIAYSSTNKVYGDLEHLNYQESEKRYYLEDYLNGLDESLTLDFSTPYGCSKGSADQYVRDWSRVYGLKTVVFRHSSIYGGRQYASYDQGWIGWFCKKALEQKEQFLEKKLIEPFTISGTGKQVRDVLHSEDLINLYLTAYKYKEKVSGQIFNIGGGINNSLSILELLDFLAKEVGIPSLNYEHIERRTSDQDFFVANIEKVKRIINWEPKLTYQEGIKKMLVWIKSCA